jgi:hypothetical protein
MRPLRRSLFLFENNMDFDMSVFINNFSNGSNLSVLSKRVKSLLNIVLLTLVVLITIFFYLKEIQDLTDPPSRTDFYKFYLSSQYFLDDKPIYWSAPDQSSQTTHCNSDSRIVERKMLSWEAMKQLPREVVWCMHPNLNPPFFVVVTTVFATLDYPVAWWIWTALSIFCGLSTLIIIFKSTIFLAKDSFLQKSWLSLAFFAYYPTFASISFGQVSLLLLLPLTLAWQALRNEKHVIAGGLLGLVASIKPLFGLFLISLLISRNLRAVSAFIMVCIVCFILGGLMVGFSSYIEYSRILSKVNWLATNWNGSYSGFFYRLFGGSRNQPWIDMPDLSRGLSLVASLITVSMLAWVILRVKGCDIKIKSDVIMAITIPAMLLISPLGWMYYFPFLIITFLVLWDLSSNLSNTRVFRLVLILFLAPTVAPNPLIPLKAINTPKIWFWDAGMYFYFLLFLLCMSAVLALFNANTLNKHFS